MLMLWYIPLCSHLLRTPRITSAVMATIGTLVDSFRISWAASYPFMTGMCRSINIKSILSLCSRYCSIASSPLLEIMASIPTCSNSDWTISWFVLLSSATNTRYGFSSFGESGSLLREAWEPDIAFRLKISRIPLSNMEGMIGFPMPRSTPCSLSLSNKSSRIMGKSIISLGILTILSLLRMASINLKPP